MWCIMSSQRINNICARGLKCQVAESLIKLDITCDDELPVPVVYAVIPAGHILIVLNIPASVSSLIHTLTLTPIHSCTHPHAHIYTHAHMHACWQVKP